MRDLTWFDLLMYGVAAAVVVLLVASLTSISRSPLSLYRQAGWAFVVFLLPVLGSLIWFWWITSYYPRRKAQNPQWEPGRKKTGSLPLSRQDSETKPGS